MPVRVAELSDLPQLIGVAYEYFESVNRPADPDTIAKFFMDHLEAPEGRAFVFVSYAKDQKHINGFISGVLCPQFYHLGLAAYKTGWCTTPKARGYGFSLLRHYERWAAQSGVTRWHATAREPSTVKLLERLGYKPLELVHVKGE